MTEPVDHRSQHTLSMSGPPPPPSFPPPGAQPARDRRAAPERRAVSTTTAASPPGFRGRQLVWVSLAIVDLILALNFIFFLAGANDVGFGHVVYGVGNALNAPFRGLFSVTLTRAAHPVQWGDVIAVVVYTIAAWIVDRLIVIFTTPASRPASSGSRMGSPPPPY